jgi:hypothetical protein
MDLVVGDEDSIVAKLDEIGVDAVHYFAYYDTARFYKIEGAPKDIDVSFVGLIKDKAGRTDYINYLLANNVPVETYGIGTKNGLLDAGGYIKVIAGSKINLSFSGISTITRLTRKYTIHKRKKGLKARVFEVAFCGGFVLSEYFPGIEDLFQVGTEIDIFHDKEELLEKIKYYLAHDEQRETIASNGYARALRDYDITLSLPKLLADIEERKEKKTFKPSEIYLDEEFLRNYATSRVGLLVRFIKSRKWKFALEELKLIFKYRKLDWFQIRIIFIEEILDEFPNVKKFLKIIFKRDK